MQQWADYLDKIRGRRPSNSATRARGINDGSSLSGKRIKIMPGLYINLGKTGVSTSLSKPGATLNFKPDRKPRATVGIPGTGLSYSANIERVSALKRKQLALGLSDGSSWH